MIQPIGCGPGRMKRAIAPTISPTIKVTIRLTGCPPDVVGNEAKKTVGRPSSAQWRERRARLRLVTLVLYALACRRIGSEPGIIVKLNTSFTDDASPSSSSVNLRAAIATAILISTIAR